MATKERIAETMNYVMDEFHDIFWTIREYYDADITPELFMQEVFAQFQTGIDKLKKDLNDEVYNDDDADEYTHCDDCYHPGACEMCEYK